MLRSTIPKFSFAIRMEFWPEKIDANLRARFGPQVQADQSGTISRSK